MPIRIDANIARAVLRLGIAHAQDESRPVSQEWVDLTKEIGNAPSRTFTAALGTALLGKAAHGDIDPLALKVVNDDTRSYDARTLCHKILVPAAVEHGVHLGATGREPLNNQPFFRYERVDEMPRVHPGARPAHARLVKCLKRVDQLSAGEAEEALAAFLRVRMEVLRSALAIDVRGAGVGLTRFIEIAERFVTGDPEGGRRGQAFVAAVFDVAFRSVRMGRINDPSRRFPGDVQILRGPRVILACEVRQKPVGAYELAQFAASLRDAGVGNGLIAALDPLQDDFDRRSILATTEGEYGVHLGIATTVEQLVSEALTWCEKPIDQALNDLPHLFARRLTEIEVSEPSLRRWNDLVREAGEES